MICCVVEIPCGNGVVFDLLTAAEKLVTYWLHYQPPQYT